jgi:uncharacterized membrane protein YphA (DoxX/SURF4 family)
VTGAGMTGAALRGKPSLSMIGLLLVEMIVGYEWLVSGVAKFVRGGFPSGLADELLKKVGSAPPWYGSFMKSAVIPYAQPFGYLIEISEVLAGVVLLTGPFIWLCAWDRVSDRVRAAVLFSTVFAAIGGTFLVINLHLANGAAHAWLIPASGFDEGVDLDSVLPAIQIVIAAVSIILFRRLRRLSAGGTPSIQSLPI